MNPTTIGLALGGGGVRGFAHAGVLEVLEGEGISIGLIVGTSFGSIIGAMYAIRPAHVELRERLEQFLHDPQFEKARMRILRGSMEEGKKIRLLQQLKDYARRGVLFGLSFTRGYFISEAEFRKVLEGLFSDIEMEQTRIPFRCVATDLVAGDAVTLDKGPLIRAVQASSSFPGVFEPIRSGGRLLVDGGWSGPIPVAQAREQGAGRVIAVDTSENADFSGNSASGLQLITRSQDVTKRVLARTLTRQADVVIRPRIGHIHWTQFDRAPECIERGREAALDELPQLRLMVEKGEARNRGIKGKED